MFNKHIANFNRAGPWTHELAAAFLYSMLFICFLRSMPSFHFEYWNKLIGNFSPSIVWVDIENNRWSGLRFCFLDFSALFDYESIGCCEWLLSCMFFLHMFLKVIRCNAGKPAYIAHLRLFPSMLHSVALEMSSLICCIVALCAPVLLLSSVDELVPVQNCSLTEWLVTLCTKVLFFSSLYLGQPILFQAICFWRSMRITSPIICHLSAFASN